MASHESATATMRADSGIVRIDHDPGEEGVDRFFHPNEHIERAGIVALLHGGFDLLTSRLQSLVEIHFRLVAEQHRIDRLAVPLFFLA